MKLFHRTYGTGKPLMILHGLFGQSDNWNTFARHISEAGYQVFAVDLRNHGLSPHSEAWDYDIMTRDIAELIHDLHLTDLNLLGHSMGGRVAMQYALEEGSVLSRLLVADMAPKQYPPHHTTVLAGLRSVDFSIIHTRKAAEEQLGLFVTDMPTRQFLLKNLYWVEEGKLDWRFNLKVIDRDYEVLGKPFHAATQTSSVPAWFYRGERSDYMLDSDWPRIQELFPDSRLVTIPDSGHWIHAEQPKLFLETVLKSLNT